MCILPLDGKGQVLHLWVLLFDLLDKVHDDVLQLRYQSRLSQTEVLVQCSCLFIPGMESRLDISFVPHYRAFKVNCQQRNVCIVSLISGSQMISRDGVPGQVGVLSFFCQLIKRWRKSTVITSQKVKKNCLFDLNVCLSDFFLRVGWKDWLHPHICPVNIKLRTVSLAQRPEKEIASMALSQRHKFTHQHASVFKVCTVYTTSTKTGAKIHVTPNNTKIYSDTQAFPPFSRAYIKLS